MSYRKVRSDEALPKRPLICVIYGAPGSGKTTLSFTAPRPNLWDFDRGIQRAYQVNRPDFIQIDGEFGKFYKYIMSKDFAQEIADENIQTTIIDTAGTMLDDFMAAEIIRSNPKAGYNGSLSLQGWGEAKTMFNSVVNRLQELGLHIIIIAHEKDQGDDSTSKYGLAVSGGSNQIILSRADMVGYLTIEAGQRVIDFNPTHIHIGKNTAGFPKLLVPSPEKPDYEGYLTRLIEKTQEAMTIKSLAALEAAQEVSEFTADIALATEPHNFDALAANIATIESATVKAQVGQKWQLAVKAKGFYYDKKLKRVVDPKALEAAADDVSPDSTTSDTPAAADDQQASKEAAEAQTTA